MIRNAAAACRLDDRDVKILEIIQRHGRISKKSLAEAVGLTLTPCFQRLQRLEQAGIIRGYRGLLDARNLGSFIWVHTEITLSRHRVADFVRFEAAVCKVPEVIECDAVGGGIDYMLRIVARDIHHYQCIVEGLLERDVGIDTYFTYIVTKRIKNAAPLPLAALLQLPAASVESATL